MNDVLYRPTLMNMASGEKRNRKALFDELFRNLQQTLESSEDFEEVYSQIQMEDEKKEDIASSLDLLIFLKIQGKLSPDKMDEVLQVFLNCRLFRAANLVKEYIDETGIESNVKYEKVDIKDECAKLCTKHNRTLELLCNTCNKRICYGCAFHDHRGKDHVLITTRDAEEKVNEAKESLRKNVDTLSGILKAIENSVATEASSFSDSNKIGLEEQFKLWEKLVAEHERRVYKELERQTEKEREKSDKITGNIAELKLQIEEIEKRLCPPAVIKNKGHHLQRLKRWKDTIKDIKEQLEAKKEAVKAHGHITTSFIPLSDNGRFVDFQSGTVVGAICVTKQAAVVVRDERCFGGNVTLSCVSSENSGLFWKSDTDEIDHSFPVVIAGSLYVCGGHPKILIACGQKLLAVSVVDQGTICSIEEQETKLVEIPADSYITSINTITSGNRDTGILVAVNSSTELIRLNRKLELFDKLNCSNFVHSIASLACVESDVLLIDSARNEVLLVSDDKVMTLSCRLKPPSTFPKLCRAKVAQWDGTFWSLIWESTGHDQQGGPKWQHSIYLRNGTEYHSGVSGTCRPTTEVASISFIRDQTLVCFTNGQVKAFSTNVI